MSRLTPFLGLSRALALATRLRPTPKSSPLALSNIGIRGLHVAAVRQKTFEPDYLDVSVMNVAQARPSFNDLKSFRRASPTSLWLPRRS